MNFFNYVCKNLCAGTLNENVFTGIHSINNEQASRGRLYKVDIFFWKKIRNESESKIPFVKKLIILRQNNQKLEMSELYCRDCVHSIKYLSVKQEII